ncbi:MAG: tetratricopeptide repeat protein [Pseudobutyrivibrio sp.]|nr:tetratricopeptide repeat protein [Pseudobutyrivibrio sp.]
MIDKEDYQEQCCLLKMNQGGEKIPVSRVLEKLDVYLENQDFEGARRHLDYWEQEAEGYKDYQGELSVINEKIGFYRKQGDEAMCLAQIPRAFGLIEQLGMEDTITHGTTLINAATGYKAFNQGSTALPLYEKAKRIYESALRPEDSRLGGLYNNMALALVEEADYERALEYYHKALKIMELQDQGELECAITYLNMADLFVVRDGQVEAEQEVTKLIEAAIECLNKEDLVKNGYYAFVCEKCAPVFGYYGYFIYETELKNRAREIYERN